MTADVSGAFRVFDADERRVRLPAMQRQTVSVRLESGGTVCRVCHGDAYEAMPAIEKLLSNPNNFRTVTNQL